MTRIKNRNIFSGLSAAKNREAFEILAKGKGFKIERIVSRGQATPEGKWLCSKAAEWVIVLQGRACLLFKKALRKINLKAGDHVFIPSGTHHRVEWTQPKRKTVWLAVHVGRCKLNQK